MLIQKQKMRLRQIRLVVEWKGKEGRERSHRLHCHVKNRDTRSEIIPPPTHQTNARQLLWRLERSAAIGSSQARTRTRNKDKVKEKKKSHDEETGSLVR